MIFDEVFQILGNGGKVKRTSWPEGSYVTADGSRCSPSHLLYFNGTDTNLWAMQSSYCDDIVADDWEEVIE